MNKILFATLLLALAAQAGAQDFEVSTSPEGAKIFVEIKTGQKPVQVGESPLKLPAKELFELTGENKTFVMKVEKEGYQPYRIMVVKNKGVEYKMDVLLQVNEEIKTIQKHDLLMAELFKAQRLIRSNNLAEAISKLDHLEKDYQEFSVISELKGIAYYMQKDLNKALSMFRMAFGKNSKNIDAYKMKVYLEGRLGLEAEAN